MFYTYILRSLKTNKYYIGSTNSLERRIKDHNSDCGVRYTKSDKPWKMIYFEQFDKLSKASKREKEIKSWKSRKRIENLLINRSHRLEA